MKRHTEKWLLVATILASSMAFIDATIVNVALPALQDALHANISQMQWVVEAYALTLGTLLLAGGSLGDLYGRRIIFLIGNIIFAAASAWCGLAESITSLIAARAIQGVGAALLVPGSLALISSLIPEDRRGQAFGTWAAFTSITTAAGPVVGGWLVEHISWRSAFFINLPFAIAVFIITLIYVPETKNKHQTPHIDFAGALLATIGLGAIIFGLIEWEQKNIFIILSLLGGCAVLFLFLLVEARVASPMVPLNLFKSCNFSGTNLITFFLYFPLYGVLFFFPLNLIQVQDYTATEAGAAMLPMILLIFLLSRWAGGLIKSYGAKLPLVVGPTIAALGFALLLLSNITNSYWLGVFPAVTILGLGMAVTIAPLTTTVMNSVAEDHAGIASGINNAIARVSGLLAIAVFGVIMTVIFNQQLAKQLSQSSLPVAVKQEIYQQRSQLANIKTQDENVRKIVKKSFVTGYQVIILIGTALALVSSLCAAIMITRKKGRLAQRESTTFTR